MVVAIDDRADVWRWSHNLIKVRPYNFFLGIGDINEPMKDGQVTESVEPKQKPKPVMVDDDRDLLYIENALDTLHKRFYEIVDQGGDEPDVRTILPVIKLQVLLDVHLVFSGIIPLGQNPESHELWIMATQFGAKCYTELDSQVTHVIAKKVGTAKVRQAQELEYVWVVKVEWYYFFLN
jgi:RNA polymerase II subunit A-like phosphatase